MTLTPDERRALGFVAGLVLISAAVRAVALPPPVEAPADGFDLTAHIEATERAVAEAERAARPLAEGERVDPNTATATELARLPGVGASLAERIVRERESNGRFRRPGDLARVAGVGDRTVERLTPHLDLRAAVTPTRRASSRDRRVVGERSAGRGSGAATGSGAPASDARGPARVNINTADAEALTRLPGIGPVLADRIVADRDSAGPYRTADDLLRVRGIGPATLERLRTRIDPGG